MIENDFIDDLREWRSNRNITKSDYLQFCKNIIEELLEPLYDKDDTPYVKEKIISDWFNKELISLANENDIIDALNDIAVFAINEVETMGYDFEDTIMETIKEISSREQDPSQKAEWDLFGATGKFEKDKNQDPKTLYKAKYEKRKEKQNELF